MHSVQKIHVQIGEVKIGREGQILNAILGSCIGLGFLYPQKGVFGLAHCLLSRAKTETDEIGGRNVDQAIYSLQSLMDVSKLDFRKIQVIVAGGSNMTMPADTDPKRLVGSINANYAYKSVRALGLRNIHEDVGGELGRQVTIDCTSGEFSIASIPRSGS